MKRFAFIFLALSFLITPLFIVSAQPVPCADGTTNCLNNTNSSGNGNLICRIFPFLSSTSVFNINAICGNISQEAVGDSVQSTISLVTSLIFIVIILLAVFVIVRAAIKYIRSEGDDTKIQEAQKAIKSVFVGIAALFVGIIGIVIVLAFFNVGSALEQNSTTNTGNPLLNSILN